MNNYGTPPLALVRGDGAEVWDADGRRYLDLLGGIAVNALGHAHPAVVEAVTDQISDARPHVQPLHHRAAAGAGRAAAGAARPRRRARVLFCNSGAEANEAAFKIARRTGRPKIIAAENAFHGRTMGALALTGQPAKRTPFEPMPPGVEHVPYGDVGRAGRPPSTPTPPRCSWSRSSARPARSPRRRATCAAARRDHRRARRAARARRGADRHRPHRHLVRLPARRRSSPDVVTLAKGLGGGLPIGACIGIGAAGDAARTRPARHHVRRQPGLLRRRARGAATRSPPTACSSTSRQVGKEIATGVEALGHPLVARRRGAGLLIGIVLARAGRPPRSPRPPATPGSWSTTRCPDRVRLAPPLILTEGQAQRVPRRRSRRSWTGPESASRMVRHFLRDDDLTPDEQREVLDLADAHEGRPVRPRARWPGRGRSRCCSTSLHPHPDLVRGRHRPARRHPADRRRAGQPARPRRDDRRHRPGAVPLRRRDRLAHRRPVADRGDGRRVVGAGGQRADRPVPPVPGARRPADRPGAVRPAGRAHPDLPRRRREQHGALAAARRGHRGPARPGLRARGLHARRRTCCATPRTGPRTPAAASTLVADPHAAVDGADVARHRHLGVDGPGGRRPGPGRRRSARCRSTPPCWPAPRPARSCCTACPRTAATRSPTRCSTARPARSGTRRRTGCTRRRRC